MNDSWKKAINLLLEVSSNSIIDMVISTLTSVDRLYRFEAKQWRLIITIGPIILFSLINGVCLNQVNSLLLSETQIMYTFSAMSQVVAGVLGLTITATVFFNQRVEKISQQNKEQIEAYDDIKNINHFFLTCISIVSVISIILCFANICFYGQKSVDLFLQKFILNETLFLVIFNICLIVLYGIDLLNDNRVIKMLVASKKKLENQFNVDMTEENKDHGDLAEFLGIYNDIERLVHNKTIKEVRKFSNSQHSNQDFYTALKILVSNEEVSPELAKRILNIRRYRNALVHGRDFFVAKEIQNELVDIYSQLKAQLGIDK